jgi:hypothetical protein
MGEEIASIEHRHPTLAVDDHPTTARGFGANEEEPVGRVALDHDVVCCGGMGRHGSSFAMWVAVILDGVAVDGKIE